MIVSTADKAPIVYPTGPQPTARLPLRAELYLLAHDVDTGRPYVNEESLAVGLAGAILLELWLAGRIAIGFSYDVIHSRWQEDPGRLAIVHPGSLGDPLADAALVTIRHTEHIPRNQSQLHAWVRSYTSADLYERVRANMVAAAVLHRTHRRRLGGLIKSEAYLATYTSFAVRAGARVREAVAHHQRSTRQLSGPDPQCVALCGMVAVLELTPFLFFEPSAGRLREWLDYIVGHHDPSIAAVVDAVDAARGDLAVAAIG